MFPSFTGSARPKRQVNLSGRNNNPFIAHSGPRTSSATQTTQNALAQAQQERYLRQQEREKPPAAIKIQRTWRGHSVRKQTAQEWRQEWDAQENRAQGVEAATRYLSREECFSQLRLLNRFATVSFGADVERLHHFSQKYMSLVQKESSLNPEWTYPQLALAKKVMEIFRTQLRGFGNEPEMVESLSSNVAYDFLTLLESLARDIAPVLVSALSLSWTSGVAFM